MLVGRDQESQAVRELLNGTRGVAVVSGPAGVGKTATVRHVVEPDALWLCGLATLRFQPGATVGRVLASTSGDMERDASQLMRHLGGRRLVVDDAQWTDAYSLAVVELVATASRPVASWRTGDPSTPVPFPAHWAAVRLGPLRSADARALARRTRPDLTELEVQLLLEMADGSPLLIEQLGSGGSGSLSPTLVSALLSRLEGMSAPVRRAVVLIAAAEAGVPAVHVDPELVDDLEHSGLVLIVDGRWWPRHALLQESILEVVKGDEVREAHEVLADVLAEDDLDAAVRHAARAGHSNRAIALAKRAASGAEGGVSKARATLCLADLLEETNPDTGWRLRVAATSDLCMQGAYREALAALDGRTPVAMDVELQGMAHVNMAAAHWELGDPGKALDHTERALVLVGGSESEAELLVRAGLAMYATRVRFDGSAALVDAREALRIARLRREHVPWARTRVAAALLLSGDPGWRQEIDAAVIEAMAAGDESGERMARESRYLHAFVSGDVDTALEDLRVVVDAHRSAGGSPKARHLAFLLLLEALTLGDREPILSGAQALLRDEAFFSQRAIAVAAEVIAAIELGRPDLAHQALEGVEPTDSEDEMVLGWARAELDWALGRPPRVDESAAAQVAVHPAVAMTAVMATWSAFEADAPLPAPPFVGLAGFAAVVDETEALRLLVSGDASEAVVVFDRAATAWRGGSDRRGAARCEWGAALAADRAKAPDAMERLERCWQAATAHGMAPVATRAARALRERGVRKPPFPTLACAPLSAAQTQVLRLMAAGFKRKEIATALGVESCTVGDHLLASVYRLDLHHRTEAVGWIAAQPWHVLPTVVSLDREPTEADARRLRTRGRIARTTEDVGQPAGTMVGVVGEADVVRVVHAVQQGWDLVVQLDLRGEPRRLVLEDLGRLGVLLDERALDGCPELESIDDDLIRHLASGGTVREAAHTVGMSDRTAARRLSRLRDSLGVATTAGLVGRWRSER